MLDTSDVATRLSAQDLQRARAFYAEKLGLLPVEERPGGLRYRCGNGWFALFESSGAPSGDHTQRGWEVDDLEATVAELRRRGVVFEEYDLPGFKTVHGIAEVAGNYPSRGGVGEKPRGFATAKATFWGSVRRYAETGWRRLVVSRSMARRRLNRKTNGILQLYASRSTVRDATIEELSDNKYQMTFGVQTRRRSNVLRFAVTENLANFSNTSDVGITLSYARVVPGGW